MKKLMLFPAVFMITQFAVASTPEAKDDASIYPVILSVIVLIAVLLNRMLRRKAIKA